MGDTRRNRAFYSMDEAAAVLGVHYETVGRWVRSGKLRGVKLSRRKVAIPKAACEEWLRGDRLPDAGSPHRWIALAGTLSAREAAKLRSAIEVFAAVDLRG